MLMHVSAKLWSVVTSPNPDGPMASEPSTFAQCSGTVEIARAQGVGALIAGAVEAGPKELLIEPLNIRFGNDDLQLR